MNFLRVLAKPFTWPYCKGEELGQEFYGFVKRAFKNVDLADEASVSIGVVSAIAGVMLGGKLFGTGAVLALFGFASAAVLFPVGAAAWAVGAAIGVLGICLAATGYGITLGSIGFGASAAELGVCSMKGAKSKPAVVAGSNPAEVSIKQSLSSRPDFRNDFDRGVTNDNDTAMMAGAPDSVVGGKPTI